MGLQRVGHDRVTFTLPGGLSDLSLGHGLRVRACALPALAWLSALELLRTGGQLGRFVFLLYEAPCSPAWPRRAPQGSRPRGAGGEEELGKGP